MHFNWAVGEPRILLLLFRPKSSTVRGRRARLYGPTHPLQSPHGIPDVSEDRVGYVWCWPRGAPSHVHGPTPTYLWYGAYAGHGMPLITPATGLINVETGRRVLILPLNDPLLEVLRIYLSEACIVSPALGQLRHRLRLLHLFELYFESRLE